MAEQFHAPLKGVRNIRAMLVSVAYMAKRFLTQSYHLIFVQSQLK